MRRGVLTACVIFAVLLGNGLLLAQDPDAGRGRRDELRGELVIFHAGSLSVPFRNVSESFKKKYPNVTIKAEAAGSRDTARKVCDLNRPCDVLGSADYQVVENLLMPEHADFNIRFVTNEMAIAHTKSSAMADKINARNWHEILLKEGVAFGRADPNRDPCGYRTVMAWQLAEKYYQLPGLAGQLTSKDQRRYIRPKETDLLALLESGEIDYLFIYRSVAEQHGLKMLLLPDEVNLRAAEYEDLYKTATIQVTGKKPGEMITRHGAPMVYSVTIPKNAPNHKAAEAYLALLLSPEGQNIMTKNGQPAITPAQTNEFDRLPIALRQFCQPITRR